jgi:LmbE family N-acetylglucosaminyl deacetylase
MRTDRSILFVFAHPDDESYSVAGTIARYSREEGTRVAVATLTRGEASRHRSDLGVTPEELGRRREAEVREALGHLGPVEHIQYGFPDGGLRHVDPRIVEAELTDLVRRFRPTVVSTFDVHGISGHPDHNVTTACLTRVFVGERDRAGVPRRLAYVVVRPRDVEGWPRLLHSTRDEEVDVAIDCADFLPERRAALYSHRSVLGDIERDDVGRRLERPVESFVLFQEPGTGPHDDLFAGLDSDRDAC